MSSSHCITADPAREQRGKAIATTQKIAKTRNGWVVPSQRGNGKYTVALDLIWSSCPDHELRHAKCKHIYAVEFTIQQEPKDEPPPHHLLGRERQLLDRPAVAVERAQLRRGDGEWRGDAQGRAMMWGVRGDHREGRGGALGLWQDQVRPGVRAQQGAAFPAGLAAVRRRGRDGAAPVGARQRADDSPARRQQLPAHEHPPQVQQAQLGPDGQRTGASASGRLLPASGPPWGSARASTRTLPQGGPDAFR